MKHSGFQAGLRFYLVGPRRFQNALLASFLASEMGADCQSHEDLSRPIMIASEQSSENIFILWDIRDRSLEETRSTLRRLLGSPTPGKLIFYNARPGSDLEVGSLDLGASGFFFENDSPEFLVKGLHAVLAGELWFSRDALTKAVNSIQSSYRLERQPETTLTNRELEVIHLVANGLSNERIADELGISLHTVKSHVYNIFKKIDVPNRLQAVLWAVKNL